MPTTFGHTTNEATQNSYGANLIVCIRGQLTEHGSVSKLTGRTHAPSATHGRGIILKDYPTAGPGSTPAPGTATGDILGVTSESVIGTALANTDFTFASAIDLAAGFYWLGLWDQGDPGFTYLTGQPSGSSVYQLTQTYASTGNPPMGKTNNFDTPLYTMFATYTPITTQIAEIDGIPIASISEVNGIAIASLSEIFQVANS